MAITIIQKPDAIAPAHNPLLFLVSSTNTGQANFRFMAVIKVGTVEIAKVKFVPTPGEIYGWIDLHRPVESLVQFDFDIDNTGLDTLSNSFSQYEVEFGEEYGTTLTEYPNLTGSGDLYVTNGALDMDKEFIGYDQDNYISDASASDGFWLNAMQRKTVALNQRDFGTFLVNAAATKPSRITIVATKAGGTTVTSQFTIAPGAGVGMYSVPTGPENLNNITGLTVGTDGAVIPSDCVSYTVQQWSLGINYGDTLQYYVDLVCSKYKKHDLFFLNRLGGFESFRFKARSDVFVTAQRASMEKPFITTDGTTVGYSATSRAKQNYSTRVEKRMVLNSDFINRNEYEGLNDLRLSPVVFMYVENVLRPVTILNNDWREPIAPNEQIENISLEVSYSIPSRRQSI